MIFNNWEANTPRVERCSLKYKALKAELHVIVNETLSLSRTLAAMESFNLLALQNVGM